MALSGTEVNVIGPGISANHPEKGSYCQNMVWHQDCWKVRKGFGVIGEWDSTCSRLTLPGTAPNEKREGYHTHLGSYILKTNFGNTQIISVFKQIFWNNDGQGLAALQAENIFDYSARHLDGWAVSIYDITDDQRWEEIIHEFGSQNVALRSQNPTHYLPLIRGYYESNRDIKIANPITSTAADQVSFTEFDDVLYINSPSFGVYFYKPAAFIGNRSKAINTIVGNADTEGYSESSLLVPLTLAPGVYSANYSYLDFLPKITAITSLGDRLVYATADAIYFSDSSRSCSIVSGQKLSVPSEYPITAVREINGNLLIFSKAETFLYQPSDGFFVYKGSLTKISEGIGCLSPSSITKFDNLLMWVDSNGVYKNGGALEIRPVSNNIRPFFENFLENPLSNYRTQAGRTYLNNPQPPIQYNLDPKNVTITYSPSLRVVIVTVPSQRCSLVLNENNEWSLWAYDSIAFKADIGGGSFENRVGVHELMDCQQVVADETDVYCIGLDERTENKIIEDKASTVIRSGPEAGTMKDTILRRQQFRSYFIGRYGRGGGCDRNMDNEDYRYGIGEWIERPNSSNTGVGFGAPFVGTDQTAATGERFDFIIGKPQKILPHFDNAGVDMATQTGVLVPIQIRIPKSMFGTVVAGTRTGQMIGWEKTDIASIAFGTFQLEFFFDRVHWVPFLDPGTQRVAVFFKTPMEMAQAGMGNVTNAYGMANYRQAELRNALTGALDATGNMIRIGWNPTAATATGVAPALGQNKFPIPTSNPLRIAGGAPNFTSPMPIPADCLTTIMWIPFVRASANEAVSSMAIDYMNAHFYIDCFNAVPTAIPASNYYLSKNYVWNFSSLADSPSTHKEDNITQAVDWAYSSPPLGLDEGKQIKARGLYYQLLSHGTADNMLDNGWSAVAGTANYRLLNTVVSSDNTQWQGQIVDQPIDPPAGEQPVPSAVDGSTAVGSGASLGSTGRMTIRTRVRSRGLPGMPRGMQYKTFSNVADLNVWGQQGTDEGTVLIDDPQYGEMAESTSTRGQWVNWMFFGYVLDKAETLVLKSAKAVIRLVGGRRRKGHTKGGSN